MSKQHLIGNHNMEDVFVFGGPVDKTSVTLAIYGEELNPDEVSRTLNCQPTKAFRRGDQRNFNPRYAPYKIGGWLFNLKGLAPTTAEELLKNLLSHIHTDSQVWRELSVAYDVQIRIAIHMDGWNKGFNLTTQTVQCISELGASMLFDIYAYGENSL